MRLIRYYIAIAFAVGLTFAAPVAFVVAQTAAPLATTSPLTTTSSPVTQNTVTTSGPVSSQTTISVGTYAGQAIMWVGAVFGTTIGAALTSLLIQMMRNAGVAGSELLRGKLQDIIVNGLNAGAKMASDSLKDKGQIEIKNAVVASTVAYVQDHGADTLKKLGIDPNSNIAVDAIKARIETAINDPATPTPPILDTKSVAATGKA
jgi:hypothetical protein